MARLEELKPGVLVKGILPGSLVTVIDVKWYGSIGVELTYKDASGRPSTELLYRDSQPLLEIASEGLPWSFDADGTVFVLLLKHIAFVSLTSLTRCWPSIPR
jgi:hypothetical protein